MCTDIKESALLSVKPAHIGLLVLPECLVHCLYSLLTKFSSPGLGQDQGRRFKKQTIRPFTIAEVFNLKKDPRSCRKQI